MLLLGAAWRHDRIAADAIAVAVEVDDEQDRGKHDGADPRAIAHPRDDGPRPCS